MNILRKIHTALGFLFRGKFVPFFNALTYSLRLGNRMFVGDTGFYTIPTPDVLRKQGKPVPQPHAGFPFEIYCETDEAWTDKLLVCMEGTADYPSLKPECRREKFEKLFRQGSKAWLALDGDVIAGFIWETRNIYCVPHGKTQILLELRPDTAFLEFMFVNEKYRRRGIHTELLAAAYHASPETRFSCLIAEDNTASIKSHEKFGFLPNGRVLHFHFFGLIYATLRFGKTRRWFFRVRKNIPYKIDARKT